MKDILARSHLKFQNSDIVNLSGSVVEGIGNVFSDFDVCVVTNSLPSLERLQGKRFRYAALEPAVVKALPIRFRSELQAGMVDGIPQRTYPSETPLSMSAATDHCAMSSTGRSTK